MKRFLASLGILGASLATLPAYAGPHPVKVVFFFPKTGGNPTSGVIQGKDGNFYGVGNPQLFHNHDLPPDFFQLVPPSAKGGQWTENVLVSGGQFYGGLTSGSDGTLYGKCSEDCAYSLQPPSGGSGPWTLHIITNEVGPSNYNLLRAPDGTLYATGQNGSFQPSAAYAIVPENQGTSWKTKTIFTFDGDEFPNNTPLSGLIRDKQGNLYGTAQYGGTSQNGVVFMLSPPAQKGAHWTETTLWNFAGGTNDGARPWSNPVMDGAGNLYGTTVSNGPGGGGTVYELSPPSVPGNPWTETILYAFQVGSGGFAPIAPVTLAHQALYGTTVDGGAGGGIVFRLKKDQSGHYTQYTQLASFPEQDRKFPQYPVGPLLLAKDGYLYGTSRFGGQNFCFSAGCGTLFRVDP